MSTTEDDQNHPYDALTPDLVMESVESLGYLCDARLLALNSYENRVYQVGLEDSDPLIAKFYRPERWSTEQILEEHAFTLELEQADISVVAPLANENGKTLHQYRGFEFALFRRQGGHPPELDNFDNLLVLLIRLYHDDHIEVLASLPTKDGVPDSPSVKHQVLNAVRLEHVT